MFTFYWCWNVARKITKLTKVTKSSNIERVWRRARSGRPLLSTAKVNKWLSYIVSRSRFAVFREQKVGLKMLIKDIKYWAWLIQNMCLVSLEGWLTPSVYLPGKSIQVVYQEWLEKYVSMPQQRSSISHTSRTMYCTTQKARRLPKASSVIPVRVFTKVIYEPRKNNSPSIITADPETCPHNGTATLCGIFNDTESFSHWAYIVLNVGFLDEMQRTRK